MQCLDPSGDNEVAVLQSLGDKDRGRFVAGNRDLAQRDGESVLIDHPNSGTSFRAGQSARRKLHARGSGKPDSTGYCRSEAHAVRWIGEADLDLEGAGCCIGLRCDLAHAAGRRHLRIIDKCNLDQRIARACPNELFRYIKDSIAPALPRKLHYHAPGADDFAWLGTDCGHDARGVSDQAGIAQLVLGEMQLRLPCRDLCLGRGQGLLRFIKFCTRGPAALEKLLLPRNKRVYRQITMR